MIRVNDEYTSNLETDPGAYLYWDFLSISTGAVQNCSHQWLVINRGLLSFFLHMGVQIRSIQRGVCSLSHREECWQCGSSNGMNNVLFQPRHLIRVYQVVKAVFLASSNHISNVEQVYSRTFLNVIPIQAGDSGLISFSNKISVQRTTLYISHFWQQYLFRQQRT